MGHSWASVPIWEATGCPVQHVKVDLHLRDAQAFFSEGLVIQSRETNQQPADYQEERLPELVSYTHAQSQTIQPAGKASMEARVQTTL